ncbi:PAS domain S-box protein [Flexibacter flexilis]|nr:PAS domain S-box protein [Flexibacter flexilis]
MLYPAEIEVALYRQLLNTSHDAILLLNEDYLFIECNERTLTMFGVRREEIVGASPTSISPAKQADGSSSIEKAIYYIEQAFGGKPQFFEWQHQHKNGNIIETEVMLQPLTFGDKSYIQSVVRDITARKQAEKVIDENERKFEILANNAPTLLKLANANNYYYYFSKQWLDFTKSTPEGEQNNGWLTHIHPDDLGLMLATMDMAFKRRKKYEMQYRMRRHDGEFRLMLDSGVPYTDKTGDFKGYISSILDITERQQAEEHLSRQLAAQATENQLLHSMQNAHLLSVSLDKEGTILHSNNAFEKVMEQPLCTLIGKKWQNFWYKNTYNTTPELSPETDLINNTEYEIVNQYGQVKLLKFNSIFLGSSNTYILIGEDITTQRRTQNAQNLYYLMANLIVESTNLSTLYENIHNELKKVIDADNFYIALEEADGKDIRFVYYVDENFGGKVDRGARPKSNGLTEYAMDQGKPLFLHEEILAQLIEQKIITVHGRMPKVWLGVPLKINDSVIGLIAIQSFVSASTYTPQDLELLHFISGQMALAIQRKAQEEKIQEQSARLNAIFESSSHLMWSVDRQNQLTSFNKNYQTTSQHTRLLPSHPIDKLCNWPADQLQKRYESAFEGKAQHFEIHALNPDSTTRWLEIFLNPIHWHKDYIAEVSGIAHDITEKKNNEIALQEKEEKFRNIFESFQDIYFRTDANGNFLIISPSVKEICGYTPEEIIGKNINAFYIYNVRRKQAIRSLYRKGRIKNFEVPIVAENGDVQNFITNIRIIYDNNNRVIGTEGVARDITELKKASEASEKAKELAERSLKVKEKFLANMSHEIRTPMNGIIGVIDLLSDTDLQPQQQEYVQTIKKSSETLLNILNDILDISKIEAGKMELRKTTVSLSHTAEKLISLYRPQANTKGLVLGYTIAPEVPQFIRADETRLLQILSNLTSNAIKFTDEGSIKVNFSLTEKKNNVYTIRCEVKDTGIGISEENQKILFGYFEQIDISSTKSYGGTGLGLAISKQLTQLMKGDIGIASVEGEGSTFWFTFQVKEAKPETFLEPRKSKKLDIVFDAESAPYLLVVDDNHINQKVASEILKKIGCRVEVASNGLEAIEMVKNNAYSLVLMDIQMPEMDGVTATQHIKDLHLPHTPTIIAMTAYSMQDDREKFLQAGMDDYIPKPINAEKLTSVIKHWLPQANTRTAEAKASATTVNEILNLEVVGQLRKHLGEEFLVETFKEFEIEAAELIEISKKEAQEGNDKGVLSALHTLKGNSGTMGVEQVARKAKDIETDLKNGKKAKLLENLTELSMAFEDFLANYANILQAKS